MTEFASEGKQIYRELGHGEYSNGGAMGPVAAEILNPKTMLNRPNSSLYGTKSFASVFVQPDDYDPGPGQYDIPSSLGIQAESHKQSMDVRSLTAKHIEGWKKVWISKEHIGELIARGTPGPGTYTPGYVKSQSSIRFGTSRRPDLQYGEESPGPVYDIRGGPDDALRINAFGRELRFGDVFKENEVGPGQYPFHTQFDGVRLAKSFGITHRAYDKVKMPGSERVNRGRASPGPGNFKPFVAGGRNFSFPKSRRPSISGAGVNPVGPGAYSGSEADKRSASCYSFGKPSCAARFNWKKLPIEIERWQKLGMQQSRAPRSLSAPR